MRLSLSPRRSTVLPSSGRSSALPSPTAEGGGGGPRIRRSVPRASVQYNRPLQITYTPTTATITPPASPFREGRTPRSRAASRVSFLVHSPETQTAARRGSQKPPSPNPKGVSELRRPSNSGRRPSNLSAVGHTRRVSALQTTTQPGRRPSTLSARVSPQASRRSSTLVSPKREQRRPSTRRSDARRMEALAPVAIRRVMKKPLGRLAMTLVREQELEKVADEAREKRSELRRLMWRQAGAQVMRGVRLQTQFAQVVTMVVSNIVRDAEDVRDKAVLTENAHRRAMFAKGRIMAARLKVAEAKEKLEKMEPFMAAAREKAGEAAKLRGDKVEALMQIRRTHKDEVEQVRLAHEGELRVLREEFKKLVDREGEMEMQLEAEREEAQRIDAVRKQLEADGARQQDMAEQRKRLLALAEVLRREATVRQQQLAANRNDRQRRVDQLAGLEKELANLKSAPARIEQQRARKAELEQEIHDLRFDRSLLHDRKRELEAIEKAKPETTKASLDVMRFQMRARACPLNPRQRVEIGKTFSMLEDFAKEAADQPAGGDATLATWAASLATAQQSPAGGSPTKGNSPLSNSSPHPPWPSESVLQASVSIQQRGQNRCYCDRC
eukprot:Hpha_TRINITY_DN15596_c4_g4::TRINITY_DN15596_c4_g4_i1::g.105319::m.105319